MVKTLGISLLENVSWYSENGEGKVLLKTLYKSLVLRAQSQVM
jgi:hypothetical protein